MKTKDVKISDIKIGARHRKDFGDIAALADSIKENGLLQPIGVTHENTLIFGARRLKAVSEILGWKTIPCSVLDITSIVIGEHAENEIRKGFTPSERDAIRRAIEEHLEGRQGCRTDRSRTCGQSPTSGTDPQHGEKTREFAAKKAGFSSERTARRVRHVVENGAPALVEALDKGEVSANRAAEIAALPTSEQKRALAADRAQSDRMEGKKQKGPPKRPDGPRPRSLSEKALYIKQWIANGQKSSDACSSCGMSKAEYQRAVTVAASGHADLIDAMDHGILTVNAAYSATKTPDKIDGIVEEARYRHEKKNHRQISAAGKPKPQLLLELLGSTYTDWKGAESNLPINSHTIPSDPRKLSEVIRLCKVVRKTVTYLLDRIEKEIEACSAKTAGKKTS